MPDVRIWLKNWIWSLFPLSEGSPSLRGARRLQGGARMSGSNLQHHQEGKKEKGVW